MKLVPPCALPSRSRLLLTSACVFTCHAQLDLRSNDIGPEGAKALAAGLAANASLTELNMYKNYLIKKAHEMNRIFRMNTMIYGK